MADFLRVWSESIWPWLILSLTIAVWTAVQRAWQLRKRARSASEAFSRLEEERRRFEAERRLEEVSRSEAGRRLEEERRYLEEARVGLEAQRRKLEAERRPSEGVQSLEVERRHLEEARRHFDEERHHLEKERNRAEADRHQLEEARARIEAERYHLNEERRRLETERRLIEESRREVGRGLEEQPRNIGQQGQRDSQEVLRQAERPLTEQELLTLSGFAPRQARPRSKVLVQAYVHLPTQTAAVRANARRSDQAAEWRGSEPLLATRHGDKIRIRLQSSNFRIDEPVQDFTWAGVPVCASYSVTVPFLIWRGMHHLKIAVEINGVPAGRLNFVLEVTRNAPRRIPVVHLLGYEPYRYVFMSYASDDRAFVLEKARMLNSLRIPFFLDVEKLRAGDLWEEELKEHVSRSDLFMLFWSPSAASSKWVAQEAHWALDLRKRSPTADPDIKPYQVDRANPVRPPPELSHLHFELPNSQL